MKWDQSSLNSTAFTPVQLSPKDPLTFPYYVILAGGPLVFLFGLLHTFLPSIASSILGFVSAFVSSIFFACVGWAVYFGGLYFRHVISLNLSTVDTKTVLIFSGAFFSLLCWCFLMMLSVSFDYRSSPNTHGLANYNEIFNADRQESSRFQNVPFTPGLARIFSLPFIFMSAVSWCVFLVGVVRLPNLDSQYHRTQQSSFEFSFYGSMVAGPLLYLAALLHAGCFRGASTVMGVFTSILHTIYFVLMGYNVTELGRFIYFTCQDSSQPLVNCSAVDINVIYIFTGGAGSLLFWAFVLALWPFYRKYPSSVRDRDDVGPNNDPTNPMTYGSMQMRESLSNSSYLAQHPRLSLVVTESVEHK